MKFRPYTLPRSSKPRRPFVNLVNRHPKRRRPYTPLTWQPFRILLVGI